MSWGQGWLRTCCEQVLLRGGTQDRCCGRGGDQSQPLLWGGGLRPYQVPVLLQFKIWSLTGLKLNSFTFFFFFCRERPAAIPIEIKSIDDTSNFDEFPDSDILTPTGETHTHGLFGMLQFLWLTSSSSSSAAPEADLKNKDWVFVNYTYKRFEGLTARGAIPSYMKSSKRWRPSTAFTPTTQTKRFQSAVVLGISCVKEMMCEMFSLAARYQWMISLRLSIWWWSRGHFNFI